MKEDRDYEQMVVYLKVENAKFIFGHSHLLLLAGLGQIYYVYVFHLAWFKGINILCWLQNLRLHFSGEQNVAPLTSGYIY